MFLLRSVRLRLYIWKEEAYHGAAKGGFLVNNRNVSIAQRKSFALG